MYSGWEDEAACQLGFQQNGTWNAACTYWLKMWIDGPSDANTFGDDVLDYTVHPETEC